MSCTRIGVAMRLLGAEKIKRRNGFLYKLISRTPEEYNRKRYADGTEPQPDDMPF